MRPRIQSLALRLAIVGGLQVLALVVVASLSVPLSLHLQDRESPQGMARAVTHALETGSPVQVVLDKLRRNHHFDLSLYALSGEIIASNTSPALPLRPDRFGMAPPPEGPFGPGGPGPRPPPPPSLFDPLMPSGLNAKGFPPGPPVMMIPLRTTSANYSLVVRLPHRQHSFIPLLITLAVGALVVSLGAVLTGRFITLPLERLSKVVGAFGAGQLTSRSDINRQDEVGVLASTFNRMADRIQNMRETERELLNNVAHELRTPLARIRVALEIAEESDGTGAKSALVGIREDLGELEGLIEDVLTASRLQSSADTSHWTLRREQLSLNALVSVLQTRFVAHHPDRTLHVERPPADIALMGDEVLLRRAVSNLLENAHKYSPNPTSAIWLSVTLDAEACAFAVKDQGMGITAADLEKVFLPFYRSEQSRSKTTGGVGLGLTLAKRIAEAHGGRVELDSQSGVGTVVRLIIPTRVTSTNAQQFDTQS